MLDVIYDDIRGTLVQSRVPKVFLGAVLIVGWPLFLTHSLLSHFPCLLVFIDCFTSVLLPSLVSSVVACPNKNFAVLARCSEGAQKLPR